MCVAVRGTNAFCSRRTALGSDGGVQGLLGVTAVHDEVEAFGELGADPASGGRDALPSTDQQVGEQGGPLAARLARFVSLKLKTQPVALWRERLQMFSGGTD